VDNEAPLTGKAIAVTGGGAGLGRAYAEYLAGLGGQVVVNDIDERRATIAVQRITNSGGSAVAYAGSIADVEKARGLIQTCVNNYGRVDGLVNNAGIYYHTAPWEDPPERYVPLIEVNLLGTIHCGIAFMAHLRRVGRPGAIVNIVSGSQCGLSEMAAYSASKGAVASLTYSWAADLASSNIRVNAVSPIGRSGTDDEGPANEQPGVNPDVLARQRALKEPALVAPLVAYLLSDYSRDVTGQVFRMNPPELSVMSHPGFFAESTRAGDWDVPGISRVVDDELHRWFQPVGGVLSISGESARLLSPGPV
jgi:NAD(P)-dependent dehydrogenase (short-subunit alcohol dehydrogenase family)